MEIIKKIDIHKESENFLKECSPPSVGYLERAFNKYKFWYQISVDEDDFSKIMIGGSPLKDEPCFLKEAVEELVQNKHLLEVEQEGVNTKHVGKYLEANYLGDIFLIQKDFITKNDLYVIDGMHRLLAYGLRLKEGEKFQDFIAYLGWNEKLLVE
ncbi:MAG: hypothetical protein Q7S53_03645 [bacterium]|nr:hypothetical protein [bacterium]